MLLPVVAFVAGFSCFSTFSCAGSGRSMPTTCTTSATNCCTGSGRSPTAATVMSAPAPPIVSQPMSPIDASVPAKRRPARMRNGVEVPALALARSGRRSISVLDGVENDSSADRCMRSRSSRLEIMVRPPNPVLRPKGVHVNALNNDEVRRESRLRIYR